MIGKFIIIIGITIIKQ